MKFNKTILIFCEASSEIGLGHLSRCMELYKEFKIFTSHKIYFFTISEETAFSNLARSRNIDSLTDFTFLDDSSDKKIIKNLSRLSIDMVLFDTYYEHCELRRYFSTQKCHTISLDYFFDNNLSDIAINLHNHKQVSHKEGKKKPKVFSGGKYAIIRNEFERLNQRRENFAIEKKISKCLIVMGGADPRNNTLEAISLIRKIFSKKELPYLEVVLGPLFNRILKKEINLILIKEFVKFKIYNSPRSLDKLFNNKDLIFCGGGTTLLESMSLGIPTAVLPQSQEEMNHSNYYALRNCCFLVGGRSKSIKLLDQKFRLKLSRNSIKEIDFKGKKRIVDIANRILNG